MADSTPRDILEVAVGPGTIRDYLTGLLLQLWEDGEIGAHGLNNAWQYDLYVALIEAGHIPGLVFEHGRITGDAMKWIDARRILDGHIRAAITYLKTMPLN